jgi:uncharacterized protein (TIGR02270 family)
MAAPTWTFIPDLLEEHLDELGFQWHQRQTQLRSSEYTIRSFRALEDRIRAHLQGVLAVGERALPWIEPLLGSEDASEVFAAALSLLHLGDTAAAQRVVDAFEVAEGERVDGFRMALSHSAGLADTNRLWQLLDHPRPEIASAAAEILAFHGTLRLTTAQLRHFLDAEEPAARLCGWRLAACLSADVDPQAYIRALSDGDEAIRRAALEAAAWRANPSVVTALRQLARQIEPKDVPLLYLLGVLGQPDDQPTIRQLAGMAELGPARFRIVGAYGDPSLMDIVLHTLSDPDPLVAAAAGEAFAKLTGETVESDTRVPAPVDEEMDEFEAEFLDEVTLPDAKRAHEHWQRVHAGLQRAQRICRGQVLDHGLDQAAFDRLDMESRWELYLRGKFYGSWDGTPLQLEAFQVMGT